MSGVYNRLFTKILDSSIWLEPCTTRIVWVTLIAAMDEDGYAHFSAIENLASRARVSIKDTQKALDCFLAPDVNSSNPENEGRRIERVPGGFFILNAPEHRKMMNREIQREQVRLRVARHREKQAGNNFTVTSPLQKVTPASASAVTSDSSSEEIYQAYPKKVGKPFALKAIRKALEKHDPAFLLERTKAYAAARAGNHDFVPHPSTWFNQERFNDDPSTWKPDTNSAVPKLGFSERNKKRQELTEARNTMFKIKQSEHREFSHEEQERYDKLTIQRERLDAT